MTNHARFTPSVHQRLPLFMHLDDDPEPFLEPLGVLGPSGVEPEGCLDLASWPVEDSELGLDPW